MSGQLRKVIPIVQEAAVVPLYEQHKKVYPRSVKGRFAAWRWFFVWLTQIVFYGVPWMSWNERQAVVFDLAARKFYIFGLVLWPQDFIYLTGLLVISALALFLFTAVAGRVWCGYACPQTVYTEIFLWFERHTEGDRAARMKLDAGPWTANKVARKTAKQMAWIGFSLWTGFTFVGYFTPIRVLGHEVLTLSAAWSLGSWEVFWVLFYGFATYGNAGFLREQVCKHMCPYARFQGAMFDTDTLIISYDVERGEPRGAKLRQQQEGVTTGDCVDCSLCVQVCPTGIDIRDGLQVGCIGCAACIDVCDSVMDKIHGENKARGLIRYSTERLMVEGAAEQAGVLQMFKRALRPRVLIYGTVLLVVSGALLTSLLVLRKPFRVDVIRDRGALARVVERGFIENTYRLQIMNASEHVRQFRIEATGLPGLRVASDALVQVQSADSRAVAVRLQIPPDNARAGSNQIRFRVTAEDAGKAETSVQERSVFVVPM